MSRCSLCGSLRFGLLATLLRGFYEMKLFDKRNSRLTFWLMLAALLLLPFATDALFGRGWVRIVDFAMLYIMLALGLNIVVGYAGLLDLGYIAFFAVGAYCYALTGSPHLAHAFPLLFSDGVHLSFWIVMPLAALLAGGFGALLGAPTLRLRGDYLAIVTLGFGEITRIFLNNLNAPVNLTNGPQGISRIDPIRVASVSLNTTQEIFGITFPSVHLYFYLFLAFIALVIFISQRLEKSRIGRAWMAIREDEIAASAMGINTRNLKLLAFAMGAMFGGASGALFAGFQGFVSPESFSLMESIMVLCMVVLGGMGNIAGVILGGVLLALLPEVLRHSVVPLQQVLFGKMLVDPESLRMLLFGGALILMMLYRPAGLLPSRVRRRELDSDETTAEASVYDATH
jgi:branched-chain amino acid transport system permease protein